ncbi:MAG: DUF2807 domain-containing protein [Rhizobacter sp.]|nr:DUF2807 domain-containing protein [Ferruginibacter sp.]
MYKQFSLSVILAAIFSGVLFAGPGHNDKKIIRQVEIGTGFKKIIINGNADVVLSADQSTMALIEGESADVNSTRIINQDGVLTIVAPKFNRNYRPVVKISVQQLEKLEVNGDGNVQSIADLPAKHLAVLINGACEITLRVKGEVSIETSGGYEAIYLKKEKIEIQRLSK